MTKKIPLFWLFIVLSLAVVVTFNVTYVAVSEKYSKKLNDITDDACVSKLLSVDSLVRRLYDGTIDDSALAEWTVKGYLAGIGDPYADYMTADEYEIFCREEKGSTISVGINCRLNEIKDAIVVVNVYDGTSAAEQGISIGDEIIAVDGEPVVSLGYYRAVERIRGNEGKTVTLTLRHDGEVVDKELICSAFQTINVTHRKFSEDKSVGIIRISSFDGTTVSDFENAFESLENDGCSRFVIDLRDNPGGVLDSVVSVLDYLLPEGPCVTIHYPNGETTQKDSDSDCRAVPIAVLVNHNTASAAELFASALQNYTKKNLFSAVVVGETTYGKGVMQSIVQVPGSDSVLKITTAHYDPPFGENYDGVGIIPDTVVELSKSAASLGIYRLDDSNDNQLRAAVGAVCQLAV